MITNSLAQKTALKALRDTLINYEASFAPVGAQIDGARFCRDLLSQIDAVLHGALETPVSLQRAAETSGYSTDHLRRLIREGQLETHRKGRKHLVMLSEVPTRVRGARAAHSLATTSLPTDSMGTRSSKTATDGPTAPTAALAVVPEQPALALLPASAYDPIADARSVLARVRGGKV